MTSTQHFLIARFCRRESISRVSCMLCDYELSFTLHRCAQQVFDNCSKASAERRWQAVNLLLDTDDLDVRTGTTTSRRVSSTTTAAAAAAAGLQAAAAAAAAASSSMGCHRCPDCRIWRMTCSRPFISRQQQIHRSSCRAWPPQQQTPLQALTACPYNSIYQQHGVTFLKASNT